jgi:mannose-6-phosphate isomerase-like protein (cupin superfamily)
MEIESQPSFQMKKDDLFVVKKGPNHRVSASVECLIMLIESKTTEHTGKVKSGITKTTEEQFY